MAKKKKIYRCSMKEIKEKIKEVKQETFDKYKYGWGREVYLSINDEDKAIEVEQDLVWVASERNKLSVYYQANRSICDYLDDDCDCGDCDVCNDGNWKVDEVRSDQVENEMEWEDKEIEKNVLKMIDSIEKTYDIEIVDALLIAEVLSR